VLPNDDIFLNVFLSIASAARLPDHPVHRVGEEEYCYISFFGSVIGTY